MRKTDHYKSKKRAALKASREKKASARNGCILAIQNEQSKYARRYKIAGATISSREAALRIGKAFSSECEKLGVFITLESSVPQTLQSGNPHGASLLNLLHSTPLVNIFKAMSHPHQFPRPN